jgi:catechol 2,3-dioxygenase
VYLAGNGYETDDHFPGLYFQACWVFDPSGNRLETFCGGYEWYPDMHEITWPVEDVGRAIFYHDRKLNEAFLAVVT